MADVGIHLLRDLEQTLLGLLAKRYEKLKFYEMGPAGILPILPDLEAGAAEVVRETVNERGTASLLTDTATDIDIVDLGMGENRYRTYAWASSFMVSHMQERALDFSQRRAFVYQRKQAAVMRAIAERVNTFLAYGEAALGQTGFFNNASVTTDDTTFDFFGATTTPDQMSEFILDTAGQVSDTSSGTYDAIDVVVSRDIYRKLENTRMTDGSSSVMNHILGAGGTVRRIVRATEAGSASLTAASLGVANKDRIVFYSKDDVLPPDLDGAMQVGATPELLEVHVEPVQMMPPAFWEVKKAAYIVPMFMCTTPLIVNHPDSMFYVDVPKKVAA